MIKNINSELFENGSQWLRADFHLHTKADKEFYYPGSDGDFINLYIDQLKQQKIGLGIITNHNKFDKDEFNTLKRNAMRNNIGIFPGIELSLKEGIHVLVVFDTNWYKGEVDHINEFIKNSFYGIKNYSTKPYPNSKYDLDETVKALSAIGYDYFIILAHIDDENGLFKVLTKRTLDSFIQQEAFEKVLAIQKSGNIDNYNRLCLKATRDIACVEGSDNAEEGIPAIGNGRSTYIKIGDFNFEALKYSLIDHKNRLKSEVAPKILNPYIKNINFEGGLLDGETISFSPELNTIIGIRGSGKSSILEILRYTLNIPLGNNILDKDYKNGLIEHVLRSGGKVKISIVNDFKEEYVIEKIYGQKEDIYKDGIRQGVTIDGILNKRPIYFGQKDLSNKDVDFEADLVNKLIGNKVKANENIIFSKKQEIREIIVELNKLKNLRDLKKETSEIVNNAQHNLKKYKEHGVEAKLKLQSSFDNDISKLTEIKSTVETFIKSIREILEEYSFFIGQPLPSSDINSDLFLEAHKIINALKTSYRGFQKQLESSNLALTQFKSLLNKLKDQKENLKEEFAKIKREISVPTLNPDDFLNLNRLIKSSELKLNEIEKNEKKRAELKRLLSDKLIDLNNLWHENFRILEKEVSRINHIQDKIEIEIIFKGRKNKFLDELKLVFKGTGIRENSYQTIVDRYADFIEIYEDYNLLDEILNENQIFEFKKRFAETQSELLTYQVENKFVIKYNNKLLSEHSLGQRASALILFLLAQKDYDILIIDQPEDDLDNQTIYDEVIKEIKRLKGEMQFIFATHNANIPVLGDSEKIIACSYKEGNAIELLTGTIDNYEIQQEVVRIMEGGREAFTMRKNIYSIWKIEN